MKSQNARILVTGGAGFIGSAVVWELNQRGITDIIVTDFLGNDEKWKNLSGLKFSDLLDAGDFRARITSSANALGQFTQVFHLGACSSTTETNAAYLLDNNYQVTKELAAWSLAQGSRFVYASSAATYGDGARGMSDTASIDQLQPLNMYAFSKQLFDLYAQREGWLTKIIGLKYFNVFGPNEAHKGDMRSLVNKAFHEIGASGKLRLFKSYLPQYKDGEQQRDFLYVKDAVDMTLHLGFSPEIPFGLYNLGSGTAQSWNTLAAAIFAALGRPPEIDYVEMPESLRKKYQYFTQADIGKLRASGYSRPLTPLPDAVLDYVRNYLVPAKHLSA